MFAGGVGESGKAGGGVQERVGRAVQLYRDGLAPAIVFSSGYVFALREAEVMKAIAVANGVPADAVFLEEAAANTYENVTHSKRILDEHGWTRVLLVSSPYHMRRAVSTWRKVAPEVSVIPTPAGQPVLRTRERRQPRPDPRAAARVRRRCSCIGYAAGHDAERRPRDPG